MDNQKLFFAIVIFSVVGFFVMGVRGFFAPNTITGYAVADQNSGAAIPSAVQDELNNIPQVSDSLNGIYVGCIKKCSFSDSSCGQCFCLSFERGCPPLSSTKLSSYLGKKVRITGSEGVFGREQCASFLKADKIEVLGTC